MASTMISSNCVNAAGCWRKNFASRSKKRATGISTRLSVVTTLLLPPTLITGIFGMNTKGLPLTDTDTGFLWAAAMMVGVSGLAYLIMRRLGIVK